MSIYCAIVSRNSSPSRAADPTRRTVEQKNWSIVRQLVGYGRYDGQQACDRLQRFYDVVRLSTNFFQPSMKLVSKELQIQH